MISSVGSPSPTFSPVNGFFVVGVVVVFLHFHLFVRLLLYQVLSLDQIHVFIKWNLFFFYDWIAINWTVFCYVIHWRCYNFSCIWILIPGLPGTSSSLPFGAFGSNSFYDLVVLSHRHNVRFRLLALLWSFLLAHLYQLFLLLMDFRSWCCDCFLSIFTFLYDFFCTRF